MSCLPCIDFHTHDAADGRAADAAGALRVISTPPEDFSRPLPPNCLKTLELHPWKKSALPEDFTQLAQRSDCIGIGEAGLDRKRGILAPAGQSELFARVIEVAEAVKKPLTVHCVGCYAELLGLFKKKRWTVPTILHYFCGKPALAEQLLKRPNWYLSFSPLTLRNESLSRWLNAAPERLERVVLETDDPAGGIAAHYRHAARLLQMPEEELCRIMQNNFHRIYPEAI